VNTDDKYRGDSAGHGRQIVAATCPSGSPRGVLFAKSTTINRCKNKYKQDQSKKNPVSVSAMLTGKFIIGCRFYRYFAYLDILYRKVSGKSFFFVLQKCLFSIMNFFLPNY